MSFNELAPFVIIKTIEHLELTFISVFLAIIVAVPLGILLSKWKRRKITRLIIYLSQEILNIPPLALIALIMVLLILLRNIITISVVGVLPGIFILFIFALMPILNHTYKGLKKTSPKQKLKDDLMLALPLILEGIRVSTVLIVGVATLVSLVGSGGLGGLILEGLKNLHVELILSGALPAAFLGIMLNWLVKIISKSILITKKR